MVIIILIVLFVIGILFIFKFERGESSFILFTLVFAALFVFNLSHNVNVRNSKVPVRNFTVVEKSERNDCDKNGSCEQSYWLYLKTDDGNFFKKDFDFNSFMKFKEGDRITFKQTYDEYIKSGGKEFD